MSEALKTLVIVAVILLLVWCSCKYSSKQGYTFLPSDYGLSPMNRSVGFVKPYAIDVNVPPSFDSQVAQELVASSEQQVLAQQSPDLQMVQLSGEKLEALNAEVQPQIDAKVRELEELLSWWKDYSDGIPSKVQSDMYSLSGFLQSPMSIQHYGLSQDHINIISELRKALVNVPSSMIKNHDDVMKYIAPVLVQYQNRKLENVYPGKYDSFSWVNVV